jgi:ribosomal protein S27AE
VSNGAVELWRENAIAVMDEKTAAMVRRDGFSQLLQCPRGCGVGSYIAMHNPSHLVFDNDQYVEQPERCR